MADIKITQKRNNSTEITISGELTIYCAMEFYQQHLQAIKLKALTILNFSGIDEIDTAGVQLLVMLLKEISNQKSECEIQSISNSLQEYSHIFRLENYFTVQNPLNESLVKVSSEGEIK